MNADLLTQIIAAMPEGPRRHWDAAEGRRKRYGDEDCHCDLCDTLAAIRAI